MEQEYLSTDNDSVMVILEGTDGKYLTLDEYRPDTINGKNDVMWFPCGPMDVEGDTPEKAAARVIFAHTGIQLPECIFNRLGKTVNPRASSKQIHYLHALIDTSKYKLSPQEILSRRIKPNWKSSLKLLLDARLDDDKLDNRPSNIDCVSLTCLLLFTWSIHEL